MSDTTRRRREGYVAMHKEKGYAKGNDPDHLTWTHELSDASVYEDLDDGSVPDTKACPVLEFRTIIKQIGQIHEGI